MNFFNENSLPSAPSGAVGQQKYDKGATKRFANDRKAAAAAALNSGIAKSSIKQDLQLGQVSKPAPPSNPIARLPKSKPQPQMFAPQPTAPAPEQMQTPPAVMQTPQQPDPKIAFDLEQLLSSPELQSAVMRANLVASFKGRPMDPAERNERVLSYMDRYSM